MTMTQDYDKPAVEYFSKPQDFDKPSPMFFRKQGNQWTPVDSLAPASSEQDFNAHPANLKPRT